MKMILQFIITLIIWFGFFSFLAYVTGAEWLIVGKYYLTAVILSFFTGIRVGIFMLKTAVIDS